MSITAPSCSPACSGATPICSSEGTCVSCDDAYAITHFNTGGEGPYSELSLGGGGGIALPLRYGDTITLKATNSPTDPWFGLSPCWVELNNAPIQLTIDYAASDLSDVTSYRGQVVKYGDEVLLTAMNVGGSADFPCANAPVAWEKAEPELYMNPMVEARTISPGAPHGESNCRYSNDNVPEIGYWKNRIYPYMSTYDWADATSIVSNYANASRSFISYGDPIVFYNESLGAWLAYHCWSENISDDCFADPHKYTLAYQTVGGDATKRQNCYEYLVAHWEVLNGDTTKPQWPITVKDGDSLQFKSTAWANQGTSTGCQLAVPYFPPPTSNSDDAPTQPSWMCWSDYIANVSPNPGLNTQSLAWWDANPPGAPKKPVTCTANTPVCSPLCTTGESCVWDSSANLCKCEAAAPPPGGGWLVYVLIAAFLGLIAVFVLG